ncbi:hypothetical protein CEXT_439711 [Caerostris extrusa]|uniref:Uncharacterized protein n=1 Tax=Caerostris extrusa TaxID=172846 RepID=A0AAV4SHC7_CAEEX|nr:hypothetical protein CEXT_439711 [Caerostris extrusa]
MVTNDDTSTKKCQLLMCRPFLKCSKYSREALLPVVLLSESGTRKDLQVEINEKKEEDEREQKKKNKAQLCLMLKKRTNKVDRKESRMRKKINCQFGVLLQVVGLKFKGKLFGQF